MNPKHPPSPPLTLGNMRELRHWGNPVSVIIFFFARLTAGDFQAAHNQITRCVHQMVVLFDYLVPFHHDDKSETRKASKHGEMP